MLSASDMKGLYAIIPTPANEGAERADAVNTVNLPETERVVDTLIKDGCQGLIALGTTGECATLSAPDFEAFVDCVLKTVNKRIPTFMGTTALGTHETVRRTRFAAERGADGILLGLPMWQPCTIDMAIDHYQGVSEIFPRLAIMVYGNARAFRFKFPPEFWSRVIKAAPTVMSAKFSRPQLLPDALAATNGRVHFLPHDGALAKFAAISRETTTACWSTAASMGPEPALAIVNALNRGDMETFNAVEKDLAWAREPIRELSTDPDLFATYNIQMEKLRIVEAGYCKAGPLRPPYNHMPAEHLASTKENARRWRVLCDKYAGAGKR